MNVKTILSQLPELAGAAAAVCGLHVSFTLANSFASVGTFGLTDAALFGGLFVFFRSVRRRDARFDRLAAVFALLMSAGYLIAQCGWNKVGVFAYAAKRPLGLCASLIGVGCLLYYALKQLRLTLTSGRFLSQPEESVFSKRMVPLGFAVIFVCWSVWILANYPGSFCYDVYAQNMIFFGVFRFSANHPPLSTLLIGALAWLGRALKDVNLGVFFYVMLQTAIGAWLFPWGLQKLHKRGLSAGVCWAFILWYALSPMWGATAQWYEKCFLYAECMVFFLIVTAEAVADRSCSRASAVKLFLSGLMAALLRNNVIYAVLPALIVLAFRLQKASRKRVIAAAAGAAAVFFGITLVVYPAVGIGKGSVRESMSIPFQQTARYIRTYEDEVSPEERQAIGAVLDYDVIKAKYDPHISDPVKDTFRHAATAEEIGTYWQTWLSMFRKHPLVYADAFLSGCCGYLAPVGSDGIQSSTLYFHQPVTDWGSVGTIGTDTPESLPFRILKAVGDKCRELPLLRFEWMPGTYTWIAMACLYLLLKAKKAHGILVFLPELFNIVGCLASPLANSLRYALPVAAAAPFMIGWAIVFINQQKAVRGGSAPTPPAGA